MDLTPQDLLTLRNLALRFIHDTHEVLSSAAHRKKREVATIAPKPVPQPPPSPPKPMPYSLSLKEASEYSGLSRTSIYRLMASKALPTLKIAGRRLIRSQDLEDFLSRSLVAD